MCLGFPGGSVVKSPPPKEKTWVWFLGWEDPLEKGIATLWSILAWEIPWTEELGELQLMESKRVKHDLATKPHSRVSEWILGDALVHWGYYRLGGLYHRLGGLNNKHTFLISGSLRSLSSRLWQIWCQVRASFCLTEGRLSSHCVLTWWKGQGSSMGSLLWEYESLSWIHV